MVVGFHIKDDGTRAPYEYGSDKERAWCECGELLDHQQYAEAYQKLEEYHEINGGFINKYDWGSLILKVEIGYLNVELSNKNFVNAVHAWNKAVDVSDGSDYVDLLDLAYEIVKHYVTFHNIPVKFDDFDQANPQQTIQLLDFIYESFLVAGGENDIPWEDRDFLEPIVFGIKHLVDQGEETKARDFYNKVVGGRFSPFKSFMESRKSWCLEGQD